MEFKHDLVDCAVIKVDVIKNNPLYEQNNNSFAYGYSYSVRIKDIEKATKFIKACYDEYGIPYSRIYLSGFKLLNESSIWTKERIVNSIRSETTRFKANEQNSNAIKKTR